MRELLIDIETYSPADLAKAGVYRYSADPGFRVLLFGWAGDGGEPGVCDLESGEGIPSRVLRALTDPAVTKWAHNASFERVCLSRWLGMPEGEFLDPGQWRCTMVWASMLGLPASLDGAGKALRLPERKMAEGRRLIRLFSVPAKPGASGPGGGRRLPRDFPEEWALFREYNRGDVAAEAALKKRLSAEPLPEGVWAEYAEGERINDRGVRVDMALVRQASRLDREARAVLLSRMREMTGLENPGSVAQLKGWLAGKGLEAGSLGREEAEALMAEAPEDARELLALRLMQSKSSARKYRAMEEAVCADGRLRGMFRFAGAARTGRFSGRTVQLQNLPRNGIEDLEGAREAVLRMGAAELMTPWGSLPDVLSQLTRTAFIPAEGARLIVADYSAIEARVIAWLAGEEWVLRVFREGGDIYSATAERMFHVPVGKHGPNAGLRQKGKQAVLACSYGGSAGALKAMGALRAGMKEEELRPLVASWREANPATVGLWHDLGEAALRAVRDRGEAEARGITASWERGILFLRLPSGRRLAYARPSIEEGPYGDDVIAYDSQRPGSGGRARTYGPKLAENVTQAAARDILCHALSNLSKARVVMHVHDEAVVEAPPGMGVEDVTRAMEDGPAWAAGLPLKAEGYECAFYRKD